MSHTESVSQDEMQEVKSVIRHFLDYTLNHTFIPELGPCEEGKVRNLYFTDDKAIMITSDRVSAFDHLLPNLIPFKGSVLTQISLWAFNKTSDVVPNAVVSSSDENLMIQTKLEPIKVECIVRGYLWGSMAGKYEAGGRVFCGLSLPTGMNRYDKLEEPLFTPTTKAEKGCEDENMTFEEVISLVGEKTAHRLRDYSMKLYERGVQLAAERGLMLIDTKYEFGYDGKGEILVMDEVNTPDSSRFCDEKEWVEKTMKIKDEMARGSLTVKEVLEKRPEYKIDELSKQYVREAMLASGYTPGGGGKGDIQLTEDQVIETSYRYLSLFNRFVGEELPLYKMLKSCLAKRLSPLSLQRRLVDHLQQHNVIQGFSVSLLAGSPSDKDHLDILQKQLTANRIPFHTRICSAHKQPSRLESIVRLYNTSITPLLIIACAGGTDALSGTVSFLSVHCVVSCPPPLAKGEYSLVSPAATTCLINPVGSSNAMILKPENAVRFALQMFAAHNPAVGSRLREVVDTKVKQLEKADCEFFTQSMTCSQLSSGA